MGKNLRIFLIIIFGMVLIAIRYFEANLFYDPLTNYFKTEHTIEPLPGFYGFKMYFDIFFRYILNAFFSLGIIWLIFQNRGINKVSALVYGVLFLFLFSAYILLIEFSAESSNHLILFYVRRFLIQPLLLFILLPAFYFQRKK